MALGVRGCFLWPLGSGVVSFARRSQVTRGCAGADAHVRRVRSPTSTSSRVGWHLPSWSPPPLEPSVAIRACPRGALVAFGRHPSLKRLGAGGPRRRDCERLRAARGLAWRHDCVRLRAAKVVDVYHCLSSGRIGGRWSSLHCPPLRARGRENPVGQGRGKCKARTCSGQHRCLYCSAREKGGTQWTPGSWRVAYPPSESGVKPAAVHCRLCL